jgi:hypothetical protein
MKQFLFLLLMAAAFTTQAQDQNSSGRIRAGIAYVHDFPGLNGAGACAEYSFPLNEYIQGGVGLRRTQTGGYPRTPSVREYTKATSLDASLQFALYRTGNAVLRIGAGYSFSFYNIRRSYPVYAPHTEVPLAAEVAWPQEDKKGRISGASLLAEYEYYFSNGISAGAKIALCKAFNSVIMGGPFVSVRL